MGLGNIFKGMEYVLYGMCVATLVCYECCIRPATIYMYTKCLKPTVIYLYDKCITHCATAQIENNYINNDHIDNNLNPNNNEVIIEINSNQLANNQINLVGYSSLQEEA